MITPTDDNGSNFMISYLLNHVLEAVLKNENLMLIHGIIYHFKSTLFYNTEILIAYKRLFLSLET